MSIEERIDMVDILNIAKTRKESVRHDNDMREYDGKKVDIEKNNKLKAESTTGEDEDKPDYEIYNFKDSGIGESWLLGNDKSGFYGNAYVERFSKCQENIIVPRNLTNEKGVTKPVEVIGQYAYFTCGRPNYGSKTKSVLVTKQVKIIKHRGFGEMWNIESFRIEEGSVLEKIESNGLDTIGYNTGSFDATKRGTLVLPLTLSSVAGDGIRWCNLFKIIIYCGTHRLINTSDLEGLNSGSIEETNVKVTNRYSAKTIFGRTPLKHSPTEVEVIKQCKIMEDKWDDMNCNCSTPYMIISPVLALISAFLYINKENEIEVLKFKRSWNKEEDSKEIELISRKTIKWTKRRRKLSIN